MPTPTRDPLTQSLLARLLQKATSVTGTVPDNTFGIPGVSFPAIPGTGDEIAERDKARVGLPGVIGHILGGITSDRDAGPLNRNAWSGTSTPTIDPRLVDPNNNPMMSEQGLQRGDINLDTGHEDPRNWMKYMQILRDRRLIP